VIPVNAGHMIVWQVRKRPQIALAGLLWNRLPAPDPEGSWQRDTEATLA
jgi:hypothetical protein